MNNLTLPGKAAAAEGDNGCLFWKPVIDTSMGAGVSSEVFHPFLLPWHFPFPNQPAKLSSIFPVRRCPLILYPSTTSVTPPSGATSSCSC